MIRIHLRSLLAVAGEIFWDGVIALLGRQPQQSEEDRQSAAEQSAERTRWIREHRRQP